MAARQRTVLIRQFIIQHVETHPDDITSFTAKQFGVTLQAVRNHLNALRTAGVLVPFGRTSDRKWSLVILNRFARNYQIAGLQEDVPWSNEIKPLLAGVPANVVDICGTGFTEMLNNAIDHSESAEVEVQMLHTAASIQFRIADRGIGVFRKVKEACGLADEREAILELAKGKLTTSPARHSGYGIFFTSRMVDIFTLASGKLLFTHVQPDDDWLYELDRTPIEGTFVDFTISTANVRTPAEVYDQFCPLDENDEFAFSKTHVPIQIAQYDNEQLVSRSQAKRVLSRFDKFREVMLDFQGVEMIGQSFADEIFRVFPLAHPNVKILFRNASPNVAKMIRLATSRYAREQGQADSHQRTLFDP
ncbi:MAG: DUF4325 domain-containing protein [Planctomycetaceae bacterium]